MIFIILLPYILAQNNPICGAYTYLCGEHNTANVCVNVSNYQGKKHELQSCPSGYSCPWSNASYLNPVSCVKDNITISILPGEPCGSNTECASGQCQKGVCIGKQASQTCTSHNDCDVGLYCASGYCQTQVQFQGACVDDYSCSNNCVCNLGQCAYYYSLESNQTADNSLSCLYGYVHPNGTCQKGPHSFIKNKPCDYDTDCLLLDPNDVLFGYSKCECGFNAGGFSYCSLAQGDPEYLKIIELFQWLLQVNQYCHTTLRYGPCQALYSDEVANYKQALKYYQMSPQLQFNDACIRNIYTPQYWMINGLMISFLLQFIFMMM